MTSKPMSPEARRLLAVLEEAKPLYREKRAENIWLQGADSEHLSAPMRLALALEQVASVLEQEGLMSAKQATNYAEILLGDGAEG